MFGMAGSPEASSARIVSCWAEVSFDNGCRCRTISEGNKHLAAIRSEYLVGQVDGVVVLVRSPGYHGVSVVGKESEDFVQSAEDWRMGKYLLDD